MKSAVKRIDYQFKYAIERRDSNHEDSNREMSPEEDEESKHNHQNRHDDAVVMMNGQGMLEPQPYSAVHDNKNICEDEKSVNESDLSY